MESPALTLLSFDALRAIDVERGGLPVDERLDLLKRLASELKARREDFVHALDADFGRRSREETLLGEVLSLVYAIAHARRRLRRWTKPKRVRMDASFWPSRAFLVPQPLGVVGILSPWNYPVQLSLSPLIGAIAAGNRVALKPSELTPRTAGEIEALVDRVFGPDIVRVVQGDAAVAASFCAQPFDHLLFTGSTAHGREVMRAAADNLTPVTLELGGKCPVIILSDADLERAAKEILIGKVLNAGQTCIAPDTLLVVGRPVDEVVDALKKTYRTLFPDGIGTNLCGERQRARLNGLMRDAHDEIGTGLAFVVEPPEGSPLRDDEIFGPILSVTALPDLDRTLAWLRRRPSPLAVYLFGGTAAEHKQVLERTRSGALVIDGTVVQAAMEALPFGGVGASGMGRYHGYAGFQTFSTMRVHVETSRFSLSRLVEPPWTDKKRRLMERLIQWG